MALSLRKQPGRTLLLVLAGTSLVLFFLNQADLRTSYPPLNQLDQRTSNDPHQPQQKSGGYPHRRIQDYSSPEYTAPGETGVETALETTREDIVKEDLAKDDHPQDVVKTPLEPPPSQNEISSSSDDTKFHPQHIDIASENEIEGNAENAAIEQTDAYGVEEEEKKESAGVKVIEEEQQIGNEVPVDDVKPVARPDSPLATVVTKKEDKDKGQETVTGGDTPDKDSGKNSGVRPTESNNTRAKDEDKKVIVTVVTGKVKENFWINRIKPATRKGFISSLIEKERDVLAEAIKGYTFHRKLKAKNMDDLILERGGRPVRSIVITTWRSGSTFIGDVLQSHPATYYHYEPLLDFGISQVRHGELAQQAVNNLRHLLTCNYTDMNHYLDYGPQHPWLFTHNTRLWYYCTSFPDLCWDPDFLSPFCKLFPFQSLKTVRLRLNLTREFLEDRSLGVQVLLLVRDPRGTMQSRRHREWCPGNPDCDDPAKLCSDLVSDYNTAIDFRRKFPHSFRVIRYEDLSFNAYNMTRALFDFFHLNYHPRVQAFLDTHTKETIGGVSSTFRNSKTAPVHWQQDLSWNEVETIQKVCNKSLKLWGYEIATNEKHLRSFKPVGIFKFH